MWKFKVGDKVKHIKIPQLGVGIIVEVDMTDMAIPYKVQFQNNDDDDWEWFRERNLCHLFSDKEPTWDE